MNAVPTLKDEERDELLSLYQVTTQDLAFFKSQQWTLTNYGLAALAILVGVPSYASTALSWNAKLCLGAALILVGILTIFVLTRLHFSIVERRERLERIYSKMSPAFQDARGSKPRVGALEMLLVLIIFVVLGLGLSLWLLVR